MAMTQLPPAPQSTDDPAVFVPKADSLVGALPGFVTEANALQVDVTSKQSTASQAAITATTASNNAIAAKNAAEAASTATAWVSGTTYAVGDVRYSLATFRSFRRKVAGAGTIDPSLDSTNWAPLANGAVLVATAIVTTPVANVDFLNLFTSEFSSYVIEITNYQQNGSTFPVLQFAVGGTVDSTSGNYANIIALATDTSAASSNISLSNGVAAGSNPNGAIVVEVMNTSDNISGRQVFVKSIIQSSSTAYRTYSAGGVYAPTSVLSGFRLATSSGANHLKGNVRVFGSYKG
jgi:hypothetical protein